MATTKQKRIAKLLIENEKLDVPLTGGQIVANSGYGESMVHYPKRLIDTDGVKEALNDYGFNEDNAKRVVSEILLSPKSANKDRLKAADMVFDVHGSKAPVKSSNVNVNVDLSDLPAEAVTLAREYEDKLKKKLLEPTVTTERARVDAREPNQE